MKYRSIDEPFDALRVQFPEGWLEFWKNEDDPLMVYYAKLLETIQRHTQFDENNILCVKVIVETQKGYYRLTDIDIGKVIDRIHPKPKLNWEPIPKTPNMFSPAVCPEFPGYFVCG